MNRRAEKIERIINVRDKKRDVDSQIIVTVRLKTNPDRRQFMRNINLRQTTTNSQII